MAAGAAPELPALGAILASAFLFLAWAVCIGVLWAYRRSLKRIIVGFANLLDVSVLGRHPLGGVASWLKAQAQNIDTLLAEGALASERGAVVLFKLFLNIQVWLASEIANLATDVWHGLGHVKHEVVRPAVRVLDAKTQAAVRSLGASVATLTHVTVPALRARVHALDAKLSHLTHALAHDAATLPARVGVTPKQIRRDARRLSALEKATVGLGAVALVVGALKYMKLSWLRCPSLLRMGNKLGCAGFGWLEAFFATTFEAIVVLDLCRFALAAQQLAKLLVPQLAGTLLVQNAVCLGGGASLPSAHDSPKVSTRLVLPSAHD